jgi:hypothetical protein
VVSGSVALLLVSSLAQIGWRIGWLFEVAVLGDTAGIACRVVDRETWPVRQFPEFVAAFAHVAVMGPTEEDQVVEVGVSAIDPVSDVMSISRFAYRVARTSYLAGEWALHPGHKQPPSRNSNAFRWALVGVRTARPWSKISPADPRMTGMMLASHAKRRIAAADRGMPLLVRESFWSLALLVSQSIGIATVTSGGAGLEAGVLAPPLPLPVTWERCPRMAWAAASAMRCCGVRSPSSGFVLVPHIFVDGLDPRFDFGTDLGF